MVRSPRPVDGPEAKAGGLPLDVFEVDLEVFQGPFDLLLQLIARRQLDITDVALAEVTDEFIAHMRRVPDLSSATEFLVVAATLLEMKAAQLLPQIDAEERGIDEDLSAHDLLFSKLMQYRAFKEAAAVFRMTLQEQSLSYPRQVPLEPQFASLLPELVWSTSPAELARLAVAAMTEPPAPDQAEHVARPLASLDEELVTVEGRIRGARRVDFGSLIADAAGPAVIVTRFLAVLELYRRGLVAFQQDEPLGPLTIELVENDVPGDDVPKNEASNE